MGRQMQQRLTRVVTERAERARVLTLGEIKNLASDLKNLEKALTAKKAEPGVALLDIVQAALEIQRSASMVFEGQDLLREIEQGAAEALNVEYLESRGAQLLKEPKGWHWISPKGVMHFLAPAGSEDEAADDLKGLISKKRPGRKSVSSDAKTGPDRDLTAQKA
ncbi:MAG: hypothetical protein EOM25_01005 [Deltaproteobacteria bacterium]|nr:hypothetical protein [Deltaproteobacteria bacterium]